MLDSRTPNERKQDSKIKAKTISTIPFPAKQDMKKELFISVLDKVRNDMLDNEALPIVIFCGMDGRKHRQKEGTCFHAITTPAFDIVKDDIIQTIEEWILEQKGEKTVKNDELTTATQNPDIKKYY